MILDNSDDGSEKSITLITFSSATKDSYTISGVCCCHLVCPLNWIIAKESPLPHVSFALRHPLQFGRVSCYHSISILRNGPSKRPHIAFYAALLTILASYCKPLGCVRNATDATSSRPHHSHCFPD
jgi:hypothetical protein